MDLEISLINGELRTGGQNDGEHVEMAYSNAESNIRQHPDIDGMFGTYAYHPYVQAKAAEDLGRENLKIVGFDMLPETVTALEQGKVDASIWIQEYYFGYYSGLILYLLKTIGTEETLTLLRMNYTDYFQNALRLQPKVFTRENVSSFRLLNKIIKIDCLIIRTCR